MKRLNMLLVPLFAMPLLVGCKIGGLEDTHALVFNDDSIGCYMTIDGEEKDAIITNQKVTAVIVPNDDFEYPINIKLTVGQTEEEYTGKFDYDKDTGKLIIKMTDDVTITAEATYKQLA